MKSTEPLISTEEVIENLKAWIKESDSRVLEVIDYKSKSIEDEIAICLYPDQIDSRFSDLVNKNFPDEKDLFYKAINFIKDKLKNQYRDENTPYYTHLLMSAIYCFENWGWENEVLASLLHDTLEDTEVTYNELVELFWEEVANLVKLVYFSVDWEVINEEEYYSNLKKSPQALLIKWADRLSNIYSTMFTADQERKNWYFDRTRNQVIPLIQELYPDLANKIDEVIIYLENNPLSEEQEKRISDLKRIKEIKERIKK